MKDNNNNLTIEKHKNNIICSRHYESLNSRRRPRYRLNLHRHI